MFYVAEALLFEEGMEFRKHGGVHTAFGEHFAKREVLDAKYHRYLLEAFEAQLEADYEVDIALSVVAVTTLIDRAKEFLKTAEGYLQAKDGKTLELGKGRWKKATLAALRVCMSAQTRKTQNSMIDPTGILARRDSF